MIQDIKKTNLRKDLDFLNKKINVCQTSATLTNNINIKINIMHLLNHYIKEREIIINKLQEIFNC